MPLTFLGRYAHEAVAVDPHTHSIYLTEDAAGPLGLYYRWTPPQRFRGGKGALRALATAPRGVTAGSLQALSCSVDGVHVGDLSEATEPGTRYDVTWVDVPERDGRTASVRTQLGDAQITPDNITLSPYGGLMMAEDGEGLSHVVGLTEDGVAYPMARNELNESEFTGPTFSQDGRILFVGLQSPGHVFAITGPWGRRHR